MLLLLSLAAPLAHADVAIGECSPMYVAGLLPAAGQQDVPLDAVITLIFDGDCGAPPHYDVALYGPGDALALEERLESPTVGDRVTLDPGGLAPDATYRITITPGDGWGELTETTFTTDNRTAGSIEGAPSFAYDDLDWDRRSTTVSASLEVTPAADAWPGLVEIRGEADERLAWTPTSGGDDDLWASFWLDVPAPPAEVCARPVQIRITGEPIPGELVCEAPDRVRGPLGCATAASPAGLLPLLAGLLLIRRRS